MRSSYLQYRKFKYCTCTLADNWISNAFSLLPSCSGHYSNSRVAVFCFNIQHYNQPANWYKNITQTWCTITNVNLCCATSIRQPRPECPIVDDHTSPIRRIGICCTATISKTDPLINKCWSDVSSISVSTGRTSYGYCIKERRYQSRASITKWAQGKCQARVQSSELYEHFHDAPRFCIDIGSIVSIIESSLWVRDQYTLAWQLTKHNLCSLSPLRWMSLSISSSSFSSVNTQKYPFLSQKSSLSVHFFSAFTRMVSMRLTPQKSSHLFRRGPRNCPSGCCVHRRICVCTDQLCKIAASTWRHMALHKLDRLYFCPGRSWWVYIEH